MGSATLIVKATRLCNLRCTYCHDWAAGPNQTMTFDVLAAMTARALRDPDHHSVEFIWHGGETTVLPIGFYQRAFAVQNRFRSEDQAVANKLQTNATRLTPEWVAFFRTHHISVGVSIDGPPEVNDAQRVDVGGRPTSERIRAGIDLLREHGVDHGVLMVVDRRTLALGADYVFDFIVENDIRSVSCIAAKPDNQPDAMPGTPAEHYADPASMGRFLARLYDRWLEHGDDTIHIREIDEIEAMLLAERAASCKTAGDCLGRYYLVEPNGDVAHCDLFIGDDRYTMGNVLRDDFPTMRRSLTMLERKLDRRHDLEQMSTCSEFALCRGWCPHERYLSVRHNPSHDDGCCGLRDLIQHVRERRRERGLPTAPPDRVLTASAPVSIRTR
jgi:uncharacterized protein